MIPEHRLSVLLDEVKDSWISNCLYHNTTASPSLYLDHNCEQTDFPTKPAFELKNHKDEVWFLQYSNDGSMLATTSKDATIFIYDTKTYRVMYHLDDHQGSGVTRLAWSPDDSKIVTCCAQPENSARIWDVKTGACMQYISDFTYPCTTAAWAPSGKQVIIGSQDDKIGCGIWDLDGRQIHNFCEDGSKLRANDLAISPNGQRLVLITENSIIVFDFASYERICEWQLDDVKLTSVAISADSRHMLISMNPDMIKLMEIDTGEIIRQFDGHHQKNYIIRSAFGGADENFIVSGSEGEHNSLHPLSFPYANPPQTHKSTSGAPTACSSNTSAPTSAASTASPGIPRTPLYLHLQATTIACAFGNLSLRGESSSNGLRH